MLGGGSIAGITFGHVAGGGGICVLGAGGTLGWGLMVRARIQGFLGNCAVGEGGCWAGCCWGRWRGESGWGCLLLVLLWRGGGHSRLLLGAVEARRG